MADSDGHRQVTERAQKAGKAGVAKPRGQEHDVRMEFSGGNETGRLSPCSTREVPRACYPSKSEPSEAGPLPCRPFQRGGLAA